MKRIAHLALLPFVFVVVAPIAMASEPASGTFSANKACDAYSSFSKGNNPGSVKTVPGAAYDVFEVNRAGDYDWLHIEMPDATPQQRWVSRECGIAALDANASANTGAVATRANQSGASCHTANQQDSYVLAITWQPGFCKHFSYQGDKPECDAIKQGNLAISHLSVHGLWPNKQSCGTSYSDCGGPPLQLSEDTISKIAPWIPNFYYQTKFGEYEWSKHGVCQSLNADDYFSTEVAAVQDVDKSTVGQFIEAHIGSSFNQQEFFDQVLAKEGDAVANDVMLICAGGKYLQEIRMKLPLGFKTGAGLAALVGNSGAVGPRSSGCSGDIYVESSDPTR